MPHFFIKSESIKDNKIVIDDVNNYHHIAKSLHIKVGEKLLLIDENQIQYETIVLRVSSKDIECEIQNSYKSKRNLEFNLYLAQSPLKSDAQLTIVEKATELGVTGIFPILTDNCTLNRNVIEKKREKWQKVMFEASKQCERAKIPTCFEVTTLQLLLENNKFDKIIVMAERSTELSLKEYLKQNLIEKDDKILVIIGPEGGFSPKEFEYFRENNLPLITLGDLILKAETAVIVTLGDIVYEYFG